MVIVGIDGAGKTSILERMKAVFASKKPAVPLHKIQSTVGLNIVKLELCGCRVMFWDLGGAEQMRGLWERYFADSQGWMFVLDAADGGRLEEAKVAFSRAWDHPDLKTVPCLLVANKQDAPNALCADEVLSAFDVRERQAGRSLKLQPSSAATTEGIRDGVIWLVRQAKLQGPTITSSRS
ncbi:hypothetical protein CTAYLR_006594 [Chrysophaeum taylorii]|uniref:ADP-ribosylation factor n=1 Tax=Chrysophaeum taylorii TaxID=2483200 RepID=A0AAD7XTQ3_9STRA|nr:hypothetical protein CTAYLR_006594 [Chrysophaeum taylorii]